VKGSEGTNESAFDHPTKRSNGTWHSYQKFTCIVNSGNIVILELVSCKGKANDQDGTLNLQLPFNRHCQIFGSTQPLLLDLRTHFPTVEESAKQPKMDAQRWPISQEPIQEPICTLMMPPTDGIAPLPCLQRITRVIKDKL
jgi:hypothetical protein